MLARVAMPAVRQKRSKLAPTSCQASSMVATGTTAADVVGSFMALLSFVDSAPRAYRLKVGNACPPISTSTGTSPRNGDIRNCQCRILSTPANCKRQDRRRYDRTREFRNRLHDRFL